MKLLIMQFPPFSSFFHPLEAQIFSSVFYFKMLSVNVFPSASKTKLQTHTKQYANSQFYTVS